MGICVLHKTIAKLAPPPFVSSGYSFPICIWIISFTMHAKTRNDSCLYVAYKAVKAVGYGFLFKICNARLWTLIVSFPVFSLFPNSLLSFPVLAYAAIYSKQSLIFEGICTSIVCAFFLYENICS
ncbi:hypothetical protein D3Z36_04325 [Lachnospiraceae bacterium]|nr:hypothetical protein [Lachnospiraceae bacterium]